MITVSYKPSFIKKVRHLDKELYQEVLDKIELLKDERDHTMLKVHKLHGHFKNCYSFSVDYRIRIIFQYESKKEVVLISIGDHEVYR
ncbi:MAG: type II toxin-antitoxin system mRNA interferase toxin, RelE/StbE family [Candidatus Taylorbacteria bacterium]|nr:type II toxin-antitoxin system mRNA interferase toxin, RelE/StbE family [Candidatus Taylorbacteria bacterium]